MRMRFTRLLPGGLLAVLASALLVPTLTQAQAITAAPAPGPGARAAVTVPVDLVASLDNGSTVYDNACVACHGETGEGGHGGGPQITETPLSLSQIMLVINSGLNSMPAFAGLSQQELLDISTFVKNSL